MMVIRVSHFCSTGNEERRGSIKGVSKYCTRIRRGGGPCCWVGSVVDAGRRAVTLWARALRSAIIAVEGGGTLGVCSGVPGRRQFGSAMQGASLTAKLALSDEDRTG